MSSVTTNQSSYEWPGPTVVYCCLVLVLCVLQAIVHALDLHVNKDNYAYQQYQVIAALVQVTEAKLSTMPQEHVRVSLSVGCRSSCSCITVTCRSKCWLSSNQVCWMVVTRLFTNYNWYRAKNSSVCLSICTKSVFLHPARPFRPRP